MCVGARCQCHANPQGAGANLVACFTQLTKLIGASMTYQVSPLRFARKRFARAIPHEGAASQADRCVAPRCVTHSAQQRKRTGDLVSKVRLGGLDHPCEYDRSTTSRFIFFNRQWQTKRYLVSYAVRPSLVNSSLSTIASVG